MGPGGGYFVRWAGHGVVVDPGFDFLRNFEEVGLSLGDITDIVITHSHIDHMNDFSRLLMNKFERTELISDHPDQYAEEAAYKLYLSLDTVISQWPNIWGQAPSVADAYDVRVLQPGSTFALSSSDAPGETLKVEATNANHGNSGQPILSYGVGLKFHMGFGSKTLRLGITSDTRPDPKILEQYLDCDVLVAHLGTVYPAQLIQMSELDLSPYFDHLLRKISGGESPIRALDWEKLGQMVRAKLGSDAAKQIIDKWKRIAAGEEDFDSRSHLGFRGTYELFEKAAAADSFRLGIISEFGVELGSLRHKVADVLTRELLPRGTGAPQTKAIITGDVKLSVRWDDLNPRCERADAGQLYCRGCTESLARQPDGAIKIMCTVCNSFVPFVCMSSECIRHRDYAIVYGCPHCHRREYTAKAPIIKVSQII